MSLELEAVLAPLGVPTDDGRTLAADFTATLRPHAPLTYATDTGPAEIGAVARVWVTGGLLAATITVTAEPDLCDRITAGQLYPEVDFLDAQIDGVLFHCATVHAVRAGTAPAWPAVRFITRPAYAALDIAWLGGHPALPDPEPGGTRLRRCVRCHIRDGWYVGDCEPGLVVHLVAVGDDPLPQRQHDYWTDRGHLPQPRPNPAAPAGWSAGRPPGHPVNRPCPTCNAPAVHTAVHAPFRKATP